MNYSKLFYILEGSIYAYQLDDVHKNEQFAIIQLQGLAVVPKRFKSPFVAARLQWRTPP